MNLLMLAPALQEEILFMPRPESGRDDVCLRDLQPVAGHRIGVTNAASGSQDDVESWGPKQLFRSLLSPHPPSFWNSIVFIWNPQAGDAAIPQSSP